MNGKEIASSLNYLKAKSNALHTRAQTINLNNGPLIADGQGPYPQILAAFEEIISTAVNLQSGLESTPLEGKDATSVADAYKEFVRVHQLALHLLTGKAALFTTGQPVADVLRQERDILDTLGETLAGLVPSRQSDIKTAQQSLSATLRASITAHKRAVK